MQEKINLTKLKDLKYEIKGEDSPKPMLECIDAIALGFYIAQVLFFGGVYIFMKILQ